MKIYTQNVFWKLFLYFFTINGQTEIINLFFLYFSDQSENSNRKDLVLETYPVNIDKTPNMSPGPDQTSLDLFRQDGERFQCPSCDSSYSRKGTIHILRKHLYM